MEWKTQQSPSPASAAQQCRQSRSREEGGSADFWLPSGDHILLGCRSIRLMQRSLCLRCRRVCRDSADNLLQKEQGAGRTPELALLCRLFTHFPPMSQLTTACIYSKMDLFLLWYHMGSAKLLTLSLWWQSNAQSCGLYLKSCPSWCLETWGITAMSEGIPHKVGEFPFTGSKPGSRRKKHHAAMLWHKRMNGESLRS